MTDSFYLIEIRQTYENKHYYLNVQPLTKAEIIIIIIIRRRRRRRTRRRTRTRTRKRRSY